MIDDDEKPLDPDDFDEAAVDTWERIEQESAKRAEIAQAISPSAIFNVGGDTSEPWHFREPGPRSLHRDEPITLGRNRDGSPRILYQQAPPMHSKSAKPGRGRAPHAARVAAREERDRIRVAQLRELDETLTKAGLSERQRQAVRLQVEGKSVREIAVAMNCSVGTAQTHLRDAKAKLRSSGGQ